MADDELEAIQAIYCQPGEIGVSYGADSSKHVKVHITSSQNDSPTTELDLSLLLPPSYPADPPTISLLSNELSKSDLSKIRSSLSETTSKNLGQPMLLELISQATDELHRITTEIAAKNADARERTVEDAGDESECKSADSVCEGDRIVLLHLDHMRAKNQYVKLIKKWTAELCLQGRLLFCQRLILILLQGSSSAVKEYIVRQRTNTVDVDSKGHPCKERMLSVVSDIPMKPEHERVKDFDAVEVSSVEDLRQFFESLNLKDMFVNQVPSLKHFPGKS